MAEKRSKKGPVVPIAEFQGLRSRPSQRGAGTRGNPPVPRTDDYERPHGAAAKEETPDRADSHHAAGDVLSDPEILFEQLSGKLSKVVDKAASKAGAKAGQELSKRLTEELDDAIRHAMSTADKVGTLVRQAVQAAVDDALRTAVMDASRVREQQCAQLVLIDRTVQAAEHLDPVRMRMGVELRRAGLERVTSMEEIAMFDVVNPSEHPDSSAFELTTPAYVDTTTARVVQRGEVRRLPPHLPDEGSNA